MRKRKTKDWVLEEGDSIVTVPIRLPKSRKMEFKRCVEAFLDNHAVSTKSFASYPPMVIFCNYLQVLLKTKHRYQLDGGIIGVKQMVVLWVMMSALPDGGGVITIPTIRRHLEKLGWRGEASNIYGQMYKLKAAGFVDSEMDTVVRTGPTSRRNYWLTLSGQRVGQDLLREIDGIEPIKG